MTSRKTVLHATLLALGFCLAGPVMAGSASIDEVLAEAEASLGSARGAGNSWTSTEKLMSAAREASQAGRTDEAMELAERARLTADMARKQEQLEQEAWQARVPTN